MEDRSAQLNEALAAWYAAVEAGEEPDRAMLLAQYPNLADELASFFAAKDDFEHDLGTLRHPAAGVATAMSAPPLLRGLHVAGHELLEEIGRGGMGVVYRARQIRLDRTVALKMIRAGGLASDEEVQRFRAEAAVVASLDHPHIVPVYEVGEHDSRPCYSMKLITGGNLAERLRAGALPPRQAAQLVATAARAVHHAHQRGILHRDLKPANILLDESAEPHVTDFGLARRLVEVPGGPSPTLSHAIIGTVGYMAPEQAAGQTRQLTTAADVWALGAILYECLAGQPPFQGSGVLDTLRRVRDETPARLSSVRSGISRDLETVCQKCLEKDPQKRYASAAALAEDLDRWLTGRPIEARPVGATGRVWRWACRQPLLAGLSGGLLALLLTVTIGASLTAMAMDDLAEKRRQTAAAAGAAARAAEQRRVEAVTERDRAEGLRLVALSSVALGDDPGLALLLALEGEQRAPGRLAQNALLNALNHCHEERTFRSDSIVGARYSADGRRVLAVTGSGAVLVWDAVTGRKLTERREFWHNYWGQFAGAALSPDGARYAVWYRDTAHASHEKVGKPHVITYKYYTDRVVRVGDTATGKIVAMLQGHEARVVGVTFRPDGQRLLTASEDGTSRLWDAATGKLVHTFRPGRTTQRGAAFSSDGKRLLTWSSGQRHSKFRLPSVSYPPDHVVHTIVDPVEVENPEDPAMEARLGKAGSRGSQSTGGGSALEEDEQVYAAAYNTATGRPLGVVHQSPLARGFNVHRWPTCTAFSPDGTRFFLGQMSFTFGSIHDTDTGKRLVAIRDGECRVPIQAQFSPDGRELALLVSDGVDMRRCVLFIVDAETGQERTRLVGLEYPGVIHFSPDGRHLLHAAGRIARVWQTDTFREVAVFRGHTRPITSATFSPDGRRVVTGSEDGTVRTWHVSSSGGHFLEVARGHSLEGLDYEGPVQRVTFSPDGTLLATTGDESAVRLWDSRTGKAVCVLRGLAELPERSQTREQALGQARSVEFTSTGQVLVLTQAEKTTIVASHGEKPREVPYCPARLFDTGGKELTGYRADTYEVSRAAVSRDGRFVLTTEGGSTHYARIDRHGGGGRGSSGGGRSHGPRVARLYDRASGKLLFVLREPDQRIVDNPGAPPGKEQARMVQSSIIAAAMSPDGQHVATLSEPWSFSAQARLQLWETSTGKIARTLHAEQHLDGSVLEWSPDGEQLLLHGGGSEALLIDARKGGVLTRLRGTIWLGNPFSPDGKQLAGVGSNHTLKILDARTGKTLAEGKGHGRPIRQVAFSADGRRLITASEDETARLWDSQTGQELLTLTGHRGAVLDGCFSPDGARVATASADGTFRVWQLNLVAAAQARTPRELTAQERARFEVPVRKGR